MAHQVHATVNSVQPSSADAVFNCSTAQAQAEQLGSCDNTVLSGREFRDPGIAMGYDLHSTPDVVHWGTCEVLCATVMHSTTYVF
jgi:hypothetical protein